MNKIDINLSEVKNVKVPFADEIIVEVNPYISLETKYTLLNNYIVVLNDPEYDDIRKYIESEYGLKMGIIDKQTNINIETIGIDKILSSGLYKAVIANIYNYDEVREDIAEIVKRTNDSKSASIAFVKMTDKVIATLDQLSKIDLSENGIKQLLSAFDIEKEKLNKFIPVVQSGEKVPTVSKKKTKKEVIL
jgi:hypothetical protein